MALQRGKITIAQTPEVSDIREVTRADLAHLTVKREPTQIQTLRDNHHRIARAVASGLGNADVAAACGISVNRVSTLKSDPAFADLVAHYRAMVATEWAQEDTVIAMLRTNAAKAQAMLSDKLDEAAEKGEYLPTRDLLGIAELGLDRSGYGKVNKNVNVNVDFAANLEAARKRSREARTTIDGEAFVTEPVNPRRQGPASTIAPSPSSMPGLRRFQ